VRLDSKAHQSQVVESDGEPPLKVSADRSDMAKLANRQLQLGDGRRLGYVEYGDPAGRPVFLFPGVPGSRLQGHPDRSIAGTLGVRLIGVDRPGYGLSDEQRGRTLLDWPDDVAALADHLGFERFAVVGISGGGPFAAACAWKIPERLVAVSLVSAMGPADASETIANMPWLNRLMLQIGKRSERLVSLPATALVGLARLRPEWFLAVLNAHLPAVDRATYVRPEVQAAIREDTAEALRSGGQGAIRDIVLLARPWGFSLHEIHVPMRLWHGTHDATVPLPIGHALATALPRCEAHFVPDTGHFLVMERWQQILTDLVQTDQ
jgi:pimeloyl-ACP methyl ester carboxylesterase